MVNTYRDSRGLLANVRPKADAVLKAFDSRTIPNVWGPNNVPDHNNLRCMDYMVPNTAAGDAVADYLRRNAKTLGVNGIIWNRRVMGFPSNGPSYSGPEGQWRPYKGPSPHTDHVHVEFNNAPLRGVPGAGGTSVPGDTAKPVRGDYSLSDYPNARVLDFTFVNPLAFWNAPNVSPAYNNASARLAIDATRKQLFRTMGPGGLKLHNMSEAEFGTAAGFKKAWSAWQRALGYRGKDADGIPGEESTRRMAQRVGLRYQR